MGGWGSKTEIINKINKFKSSSFPRRPMTGSEIGGYLKGGLPSHQKSNSQSKLLSLLLKESLSIGCWQGSSRARHVPGFAAGSVSFQ